MWWIEDGKQRHSAKYREFSARLEQDSWKREGGKRGIVDRFVRLLRRRHCSILRRGIHRTREIYDRLHAKPCLTSQVSQ